MSALDMNNETCSRTVGSLREVDGNTGAQIERYDSRASQVTF